MNDKIKACCENCDWFQHWRKAFDEADIDDVAKTLKLPNFDYEIFEEITGISKADFDAKLKGVTDER